VFEKIGCFFQLSMLFQNYVKESINPINQSMVIAKLRQNEKCFWKMYFEAGEKFLFLPS